MRPHAPKAWVAFSAEPEFFTPGQPPQYGRHVQDEHGCRLREAVEANGDRVVTIKSAHQHHLPFCQRRVDGKAPSFEGFEAFILQRPVRTPSGDSVREVIVIPALNFFEPVMTMSDGRTITAWKIVVGPQVHDQFHTPLNAKGTPIEGIGGRMHFAAVVVSVTFPGGPARELTTLEGVGQRSV